MKIMIKDPNSPYLYTLSQGKLLSNLTPYSSTYPNRPNVSVPPGFPLIYWLSITVSAFTGCSHEATELFNKFVEHCQQMEETKKLMMNAIRVFVFLVGKIVKDVNRWAVRGGSPYNDWGSTWKGCLFKGSGIWKGRPGCRYNREEKSLCHVAMVAKFLDETNRLSHFKVYSHYFKLHWSDLGETFLGPYISLFKFRKIKRQFFLLCSPTP